MKSPGVETRAQTCLIVVPCLHLSPDANYILQVYDMAILQNIIGLHQFISHRCVFAFFLVRIPWPSRQIYTRFSVYHKMASKGIKG